MPNVLPVTIDFGTIPQTGQGYTPQQFANRLGLNGRIFTEQAFALFTTGATAPTSDTGPWAKDGNTWYYWNSGSGTYVPFIVPAASLRYSVSSVAPDPAIYLFWIKLDGGGSPLGVFTYFSGAWTDVYGSTGYMTVAAFNAAIANYSTTAQMNTAIANAIAAIPPNTPFNSNPARAQTPGSQTFTPNGAAVKMTLNTADINPGAHFDTATSEYVAPATGVYNVGIASQIDGGGGGVSAATMEVTIGFAVNGAPVSGGDQDSTPSPNGTRWSPGLDMNIALNAGDRVSVLIGAADGVGAGLLTVTAGMASFFRLSQ